MVETLTESFCERCGTRYEFRAPTRLNPLRKTRGFIGGLKNYLTSQDALSDAMGDAMRSEEDQLAAAQLDAFHETFNFCISCRQYTCLNCWNDAEGRCRSCAPIAGTDDLTERLMAVQAGTAPAVADAPAGDDPMLGGDELSRRLGLDAWPPSEVPAMEVASNGDATHAWPEADPLAAASAAQALEPVAEPALEPEPEPMVAELEPEPEPMVAELEPEPEPVVAELEPEPAATLEPVVADESQPWGEPEAWNDAAEATPEPASADEPAIDAWPVAAEAEEEPVVADVGDHADGRPLHVVGWESDAAYDVVEPEPMVAELAPEPEPEPMVAELAPEPEPEPMVAELAPEPEPPTVVDDVPRPMPQVAPISETILHFPERPAPDAEPPAVAAEDDNPELAARRAQLDLLGLGDPGEGPVAPERPAVLPYRSRGASPTPVELAMRAGGRGFWEASAREVAGAAAQVGVQNCGECGLSLSATARFCRRCGTRQARSA